MTISALLDTDILVDLLRQYPPSAAWIKMQGSSQFGIVTIAWMEVLKGTTNKLARSRAARFLTQFDLVYLTDADQEWAMRHFHQYFLSQNVGILDCLIAAPAQRLNLPLYTRNLKHMTPLLGALAQQPY